MFSFSPDILNEGELFSSAGGHDQVSRFYSDYNVLLLYGKGEKKPDYVIMNVLNTDQVNLVCRKLADWLRYASIHQGASMSSGGFFISPRSRQVKAQTHLVAVRIRDTTVILILFSI